MTTINQTSRIMQFELSVLVEEITNYPPWIGNQDGFLIEYELEQPVSEEFSIDWMHEHDWKDEMTFDQKCGWFSHHLYHGDFYEKIAEEHGEDPEDFVDCGSCMDFRVIDFSEST